MKERKNLGILDNGISTIKLSVTPDRDYSGGNSVNFKVITTSSEELKSLLTYHNFSLIHWKESDSDTSEYNRYRKGENFESASGLIIDFDNTLTIDAAKQRLDQLGFNYYLITSKSHGTKGNRFHVLIPFDREVKSPEDYRQIIKYVRKQHFPEGDPAVGDLARFFYGSPDDALWYKNTNGAPLNSGSILSITNWEIQPDYSIKLSDGSETPISSVTAKSPCFCPHPDHDDNSPSAFVSLQDGKHYVHCSSCNWTWWEADSVPRLEKACKPYWSYGTDIWEFGMISDMLFYDKIGRAKFHILTETEDQNDKAKAFRYLVKNKHLRFISRIDYVSDSAAAESYYNVDLNSGVISAHHRPIPVKIQDNAYIEDYLNDRFGKYIFFIKQWLAVYCHSNYNKLSNLIFLGNRGSGKSSFAEVIGEIYPTLSYQWGGNEENFTYECEKKMLIVEENISDKVSQYKTLKKYSGQKHATVKRKFKDPYQVKNNVNIILLSNELIPLFVSREELPTNAKNNQFFVFEFPPLSGAIDPQLQDKLLARIGHYIQTELKTVYAGINTSGYRYSIDVPITDEERELFAANTSDLESDVDTLVDRLIEQYDSDTFPDDLPYYPFIEAGQLPITWVKYYSQSSRHYNQIIKGMRRQRLVSGKADKVQINGKRLFCLPMTDKLTEMIDNPEYTDLDTPTGTDMSDVSGQVSCKFKKEGL